MGSCTEEQWRSHGIHLVWRPRSRLLEMSFTAAEQRADGEAAEAYVQTLERWTGGRAKGYGILVNCAGLTDADPAWRATLSKYHSTQEVHVSGAWYNATTLVRVMVEMFVLATPRIQGRVFKREDEARAYLLRAGFG